MPAGADRNKRGRKRRSSLRRTATTRGQTRCFHAGTGGGAAKISFWSLNAALAWMIFASLVPLGLLQLYESVNHGYFEACSLKFLGNPVNAFVEWLRFPGDAVFIVGGVLPVLYLCWQAVRTRVPKTTLEEPAEILSSEITGPANDALMR